ncbi:MAG: class I tRNA ligase family protein, partial [Proteobacteria bacterium]|nr:class I tRNA ligase family protein [Pseudomonadota bacterium]
EGANRRAVEISSGRPAAIGSIEKMSKSKKNLVDPDDIISHYGADCARWFMLSDSPPERDVIWTEAGVAGAGRFIQRVWRIVDEIAEAYPGEKGSKPASFGPEALEVRKGAHRALDAVGRSIESLRFNVAVANIHELSNVLQSGLSKRGPDVAWAIREAGELLVLMIGPMMPHLAEECWARLGYNTLVANEPWPAPEPELLVDDQVTIAVQVNGKRRDELVISRSAKAEEVEAAALQLGSVVRALDGRPPKKVIVVPQRIVNVVG